MTITELFRLLCNLVRIGTVTDVNTPNHTARVSTGGNETDWVQWATSRAGDAVIWHAPTVGEQVIILAPGGEMTMAVIIGSLYSAAHPAPDSGSQTGVIAWPDGARFAYDPANSELTLAGIKTLTINSSDSVSVICQTASISAETSITLDAPEVICTEKLTASTLSITKGGEMNGAFTGNFTINGVKPDDHTHGEVESGSSWTKGTK